MAKKFLYEEEGAAGTGDRLGYLDGFRFGFGFFLSWLLGIILVSTVALALSKIFKLT